MPTIVSNGANPVTVLTGADAQNILRLAEGAHLPSHFTNIIVQVEAMLGADLEWLPLGGAGRVAHSALGSSGMSTHLLTEPVINQFDAALEMSAALAALEGDDYVPQSMAEAAARWLGLPEGGLPVWDSTPGGKDRTAFVELAMKSQLTVRQGSGGGTPTMIFRDSWIGQHPADHEGTILSLHRGLKADVPYLAGQYGHGAAYTFAFSNGGQILISRRHPDLLPRGYDDLVGLSLVRRRMPSETGLVNPIYEFAVCPTTRAPVAFYSEALTDPRWHGLHRGCIDYEMPRTARSAIYDSLEYNISNPALPYAFWDERPNAVKQKMYLGGITSRLQRNYDGRRKAVSKTDEVRVPYRRTKTVEMDAFIGDGKQHGSIEITLNYVTQEGNSYPSEQFVPAKEAELWTLHGQRHFARPRIHFGQAPIKFEAIRNNLVVEVKLDQLSPDDKANILTTDRQGAAERAIRFKLEEAIDEQIAGDGELQTLNEAALSEAFAKAAGSGLEDLKRELVQFENLVRKVSRKVKVKKTVMQPGGKRPRPPVKPLLPISPLNPHPTFLRFRKEFREVIHITPGGTASVLIEADAVDGYFNGAVQPSYQFNPATGLALAVYSKEDLQDGRMRVRMKASATAAFGKTQLTAAYLPPNASAPLTTVIDVEIAPPKARTPGVGPMKPVEIEVEEDREVNEPPPSLVVYEHGGPSRPRLGRERSQRLDDGDRGRVQERCRLHQRRLRASGGAA